MNDATVPLVICKSPWTKPVTSRLKRILTGIGLMLVADSLVVVSNTLNDSTVSGAVAASTAIELLSTIALRLLVTKL